MNFFWFLCVLYLICYIDYYILNLFWIHVSEIQSVNWLIVSMFFHFNSIEFFLLVTFKKKSLEWQIFCCFNLFAHFQFICHNIILKLVKILLCQEFSNTFILSVIIFKLNQLKLKLEKCFNVIFNKIKSHNIECFFEFLSLYIFHNACE